MLSVVAVFLAALCGVDCKKSLPPPDGGGEGGGGGSGSGGAAGLGGAAGSGGASGSAGQAGGGTGGAAGAATTCHAADHSYVATPADVDGGGSCTFTIPDDPTGGGKDRIKVSIDGDTITRDPARAQGWDYTDASLATLQLFGTACAAVTNGGAHTLCVTFIYLPP